MEVFFYLRCCSDTACWAATASATDCHCSASATATATATGSGHAAVATIDLESTRVGSYTVPTIDSRLSCVTAAGYRAYIISLYPMNSTIVPWYSAVPGHSSTMYRSTHTEQSSIDARVLEYHGTRIP